MSGGVWWCLDYVWWCLMHVWWCLVVSMYIGWYDLNWCIWADIPSSACNWCCWNTTDAVDGMMLRMRWYCWGVCRLKGKTGRRAKSQHNSGFLRPPAGGGFWFKLLKRQDMKRQNQKIVISETRTWENWESNFYKNEIRVSFQWNVQRRDNFLFTKYQLVDVMAPLTHRSFKYQQFRFCQKN